MPRNGSGIYALPVSYLAVTGEEIQAAQHNAPLEDLAVDANAVRPISAGGTGGATPAAARDALGLKIGAQVQGYDELLQAIASLTTSADQLLYTTGVDTIAVTPISAFARAFLEKTDAFSARAALGADDASNLVSGTLHRDRLSGAYSFASLALADSLTLGTSLSIANGGTSATTVEAARANLAVYSKGEIDTRLAEQGSASIDASRLTTGTIPEPRLPLSLQPLAQNNVISDCNTAVRNGWYAMESTAANKPMAEGGYLFVVGKHTDWWVQYFFTQTTSAGNQLVWKRFRAQDTWGPWVRVYEAEAELISLIDARIAANAAPKGSSGILDLAGVSTGLITGIPAGASKVSVALAPIVTNNGYPVGIQLGTASGIVTAGYSGGYAQQYSGNTFSYTGTNAAYFVLSPDTYWSGLVEFTRFNVNKWLWQSSGMLNRGGAIQSTDASGNVDLGNELTQLQIMMTSGNAFNSGNMKLFWE